jgi:hypothetical protein
MPVADELHTPPLTALLNVEVVPTHTLPAPEIVPAEGTVVFTVTTPVATPVPQLPDTVYDIVAVPAVTPVTTPVLPTTPATDVFDEDHVPPLTVLLSVVVPLMQTVAEPEIVPADAVALTVTTTVLEQPANV